MIKEKNSCPVISGRTRPALVFFVIACYLFTFCIDRSFAAQSSTAGVIKVHDGDTVTLRINGKMRKARLIGIDAPEMNQRPWGRRAKDHLIDIMNHSDWKVTMETDEVTQDKYGRSLVYLWTQEHELINERMLLDGYALLFTIKPNVRYRDTFSRAEKLARRELKGIWGPNGLKESPAGYREKHPRKQY
jgi:micrococcal nuclease